MSTLTVSAPHIALKSPSSWASRADVVVMLKTIWNNYGKFIQFASKESNIDPKIISSFIAVESGGKPRAGSGNTKNLMQANVSYMKSQLENEYKSNRLSEAEKQKLAQFGIKFDSNGKTREITIEDNFKPELNILIGSIVLGQLIDQPWAKDANGNLKLASVITAYNAGMYGEWGKIAIKQPTSDPKKLHDALVGNLTTQSYIRKMYGKNGALDVATNEYKNIIV